MNLEDSKLDTGNRGQGKKVALGLSGGVDSAVCVALLVEQGYEVTGVYLECWNEPGCRTDQDRKDALEVALGLGIPYKVLDFKKAYREKVVEYFYREYEAGRTPNPDTVCNREIKFGLFYEWAIKEQEFDYVATGHYARVEKLRAQNSNLKATTENFKPKEDAALDFPARNALPEMFRITMQAGTHSVAGGSAPLRSARNDNADRVLVRGRDPKKDQSYFLYQLRPEQLGNILFPIGGMLKNEVREEAKKRGLSVADKPDSQGICFIGDVDVRELLKKRIEPVKGNLVVVSGQQGTRNKEHVDDKGLDSIALLQNDNGKIVLGEHEGVWFYTVGQRLGKELDQARIADLSKQGVLDLDPQNLPALYVVEKDVERNELVVGAEDELLQDEFEVGEVSWLVSMTNEQKTENNVYIRIRNLGEIVEARITKHESRITVNTKKSLRGVAEGQACVFYSSDDVDAVVLGGGVIVG